MGKTEEIVMEIRITGAYTNQTSDFCVTSGVDVDVILK